MVIPPDNQATVRSLMDAALKSEIQEIVELIKIVPESLQFRAFEILLGAGALLIFSCRSLPQLRLPHLSRFSKGARSVSR